MDYLIIGGGMFAITVSGWALWQAINKYQAKQERDRRREQSRQKRSAAAKAAIASKKLEPANKEGNHAGLQNYAGLSAGLNGTDKSLHGRGEL